MSKIESVVLNMDGQISLVEFGLSNLSVIQTAIAEEVVSLPDAADALYSVHDNLYRIVEEMRKNINSVYQDWRVAHD